MDDIKVRFGERIKELRKAQSLSQEALALKANLDRTYIASVEKGKRNIAIVNIEKIAQALDCSMADFFETFNKKDRKPSP